jgi:hypothetical protein
MNTKQIVLMIMLAAALVLGGVIGYQQFKPIEALAAPKSLVGTWTVTVTPEGGTPFIDGMIFSSDGTTTVMEQDGYLGVGVWEKLSNNRFAFSFWESYLENDALITSKVSSTVELSGKDQYSGPFNFQIFSNGELLVQGTGAATGVRQHVELTSDQTK